MTSDKIRPDIPLRQNLRRLRAEQFAAAVFSELSEFIPDAVRNRAFDKLCAMLAQAGVEVLTDYERQMVGLPPRGSDGWTVEELLALEHRRLEALSKPLSFFIQTPVMDGEGNVEAEKPSG